MPVEVESSSNALVNARLTAASPRRSRNGNQIESSSDFYAELFRFQQTQKSEEIAPPAPLSESKSTPSKRAEADSSVTTESDSSPEDDASQDSEASNPTETNSVNASQVIDSKNRSIEQDFIASSEEAKTEEVKSTKQPSDLMETAGRIDKDAPGQGRQNQEQSLDNQSNRSDRSRELKKEESRDSSSTATTNQQVEAKERPSAPQPTQENRISPTEVDDSRGFKKEQTSEVANGTTPTPRNPNRAEEIREAEASLASRKPGRPAQDNTATSTERPVLRKTIATPERISQPERASRSEASREPSGRNAETASNPIQEGSRTRRRNDRNQGRNRSSDAQREPADRVPANEPSSARRPESTFSPVVREPVFSQGMRHVSDSEAPLNALPPTASTSNAVQPSTASPTVVATDVTSSTRAVAQSTSSANRVDQPLTPSAIAAASTNDPSLRTPDRPSTSAPASAGSRLTQHQETKLVQRVLRGMEQLADGGGQVRLRLHPPELGSLQMSLRIEGNAIFAEMQVETTSARDALMKNLPVLKERLSEQGMQIELFDVRADGSFDGGAAGANSQGTQDNGNSGSSRQSSRYVDTLNNRLTGPGTTDEAEIARRWTRTHGALDFQA